MKGLFTTAIAIGLVVAANAAPNLTSVDLSYDANTSADLGQGNNATGVGSLSETLTGFTLGDPASDSYGDFGWVINYSNLVGAGGSLTVTGSFNYSYATAPAVPITRFAGAVNVFDLTQASPVASLALGQSAGVVTGGPLSGTITFTDTVTFANLSGSGHFEIEEYLYVPTGGTLGGTTSSTLNPVPEPAPVAALAFGAVGLLVRRRKNS